jgi:APA family basic amino acid/polyamine antiporter
MNAENSPRRDVGALDATMVTVGAMIGSGIFQTPAEVARRAGSTSRALLVWALGAALSLLGALSLAEPGAALPGTGGLYVYLRRAYGPLVAFLFGWAMLLVLVPSSVAFFAGVTARHLAPVVGVREAVVSSVVIALVAALNVTGVRRAARVQSVTAAARAVGLCVAALAAFGADAPSHHEAVSAASGELLAAVVPVLWAYDGWIDVTSIAGEVRDPGRTIPRALVLGTTGVAAVYMLIVAGYHRALGTAALAASTAPGNALGAHLAGAPGMRAMAALVTLSAFGGCMIGMLTGTRVIAAMGADGDFAPSLARVGPAGTPDRAIAVTASLALAYALSPFVGRFAEVFVVGAWPFYALGALATIVLRVREPELARPYRVPGYPWTVLGFFAATVLMLVSFARSDPGLVAASLGLIALGAPVYVLGKRFVR